MLALARSADRLLGHPLQDSLTARRVARRLGFVPVSSFAQPPEFPVGVKLELTYHCNLGCPFCYTDSPRRTREGTQDLPDDTWRGIVAQALELGVIEAVVTGGEPLLRADLALELLETLDAAGVAVVLNTNGWFVDDRVADRLAPLSGLQANLSIDGATAELHDGARGVPGSWDRVVAAADRLLQRGGKVHVIHVVTPANERYVDAFLEQVWLLGVQSVRLAVVVPSGAAARTGGWAVNRRSLRRAVAGARRRYGEDFRITLHPGTLAALASIEDVPPSALLVRPNGAVLIDSSTPFVFGSAVDEPLEEAWRRVARSWPHPDVSSWAGSLRRAGDLPAASPTPYLDDEVAVAGGATTAPHRARRPARNIPSGVPRLTGIGDLARAREYVLELALGRRYRLAPLRSTGDSTRLVHVRATRRVHRLNAAAGTVMDSCAGGTPAAAALALTERYHSLPPDQAKRDALVAVRRLLLCGVLEPAAP